MQTSDGNWLKNDRKKSNFLPYPYIFSEFYFEIRNFEKLKMIKLVPQHVFRKKLHILWQKVSSMTIIMQIFISKLFMHFCCTIFKLLPCIKRFKKLSDVYSRYPVGIFEDITAMFLELASKTPQNQTNDKTRFLTNSSQFCSNHQSFVE